MRSTEKKKAIYRRYVHGAAEEGDEAMGLKESSVMDQRLQLASSCFRKGYQTRCRHYFFHERGLFRAPTCDY